MPPTRLILFDIDSTLVATGGAGRLAEERAFEELFGAGQVLRDIPMAGRTDRAILAEALKRLPGGPRFTGRLLRRFVATYRRHLAKTLFETEGRVLAGVPALLEALRQEGLALGLATGNFRAAAMLKLRHYGLGDYFADGAFGDEQEDRALVVAQALARFRSHLGDGLRPQEVWVVGDTPLDIAAGQANGCLTLAVATGSSSLEELARSGPSFLLSDLSQVDQVLAVLLRRSPRATLPPVIKPIETPEEWRGARGVRRRVFVEEQGIPEELEEDESDGRAHHVVALQDGEIVGTGRLVVMGSEGGRIGRMAVLPPHRLQGIGIAILRSLEAEAQRRGLTRIALHAQVPALGFYQRAGYTPEGELFEEAGIPHQAMVKALQSGVD